ncbi:hypothetical protein [Marimonas arenosa]|uniref:Uncharacterized protein n=1 Tax=Marimonas arenosa TaxID=1795305 RepID=A0AAE4B5T2_9RHOB|nr:hypothetical protein [Marimonas arenosa]MDQ2091670.1 hypothetical protein [Marimonas arenosa]
MLGQITRLIALMAALFAALAGPVAAGAWPRDRKEGFLSATSRISGPGWAGPYSVYSTTYIEYGLGRRLTAGFDIGHGISGSGKAVVFLRKSLPEMGRGHVVAAELGLGQIAGEPTVRPGLSWGRGITRRSGSTGWLSLETVAEFRLDSGRVDLKADFTLGLNHGARLKSILQVQTGVSQGDPSFIRAAPSVAVKLGRKAHVELGLTAGIVGDTDYGLKLGLWREF